MATSCTIEVLDCGALVADLSVLGGPSGPATVPVPGYLVRHPDGLVLFDAGMHPDLRHDVSRLGVSAQFFEPVLGPDQGPGAQLARLGVRPTDLAAVVVSHLHFDHVGGLCEVAEAPLVVHEDEWAAAQGGPLVELGAYLPDDYQLGQEVQTVGDGHDLFADGAVVCLATPGHTPGHQVLRVRTADGPVVLCADACYFLHLLESDGTPPISWDRDLQLAGYRQLRGLRDEGAELVLSHDETCCRPTRGR